MSIRKVQLIRNAILLRIYNRLRLRFGEVAVERHARGCRLLPAAQKRVKCGRNR